MNQKSKSSSSSSDHDSELWLAPGVLAGSSAAAAAAAAAYAVISTRRSWRFRRQVVGIIPARFASSRFPGKPLVPILGKPMIQRTWERAKLAATLNKLDGALGLKNLDDIELNAAMKVLIDGVIKALQAAPDAVFSTAVTSLKPEDALDPNRVKCVVDTRGYAIYFSRGLIPYNKSGKVNLNFPYLLHLGIQSYDTKFLRKYPELSPTPLQEEEDLEQLKILEHGYKMKVIKVDHEAHGVDTPEDVDKIESLMRQKNLS